MNMLDYLTWRGDLTFAQSGFCEVDNLLFCYLIYVNLDEVAPKMEKQLYRSENCRADFLNDIPRKNWSRINHLSDLRLMY